MHHRTGGQWWMILIGSLYVLAPAAASDENAPFLKANRTESVTMRVDDPVSTFRIHVPHDALLFDVKIENAQADLDLYLRYGFPIEDADQDADYVAATDQHNEVVRATRWSDQPLESGNYYVDVYYAYNFRPRVDGRQVDTIKFDLSYQLVRAKLAGKINAGKTLRGATSEANGFMSIFTINVPPDAEQLRVDLADLDADLDLYVRRGQMMVDLDSADYERASARGRESLVIDKESHPPLRAGQYCICVIDEYESEHPVAFRLYTSLSKDPPQELMRIVPIPKGETPLDRLVHSTVELIGPDGGGSGTIVSPSGIILTNHHVVEGLNGKLVNDGEIVVAITVDPRKPPVEMYRAKVVRFDKQLDLALVQIISGMYGQSLPDGQQFPPVPLGDPGTLKIGSFLGALGYPAIGGTGSRVSITLNRGIVAGFEWTGKHSFIKTDAQLNSGVSGGAAFNDKYQLIGVPSQTTDEIGQPGMIGFVRPLTMIPAEWRTLMK